MKYGILLFTLTFFVAIEGAAQSADCRQSLASLTVPQSSYAEAPVALFEHHVSVYVPAIKGGKSGFEPFRLWIVEGVYGPPFAQAKGSLDEAGFEKLRESRNLRTTPISVARGDETEGGKFTLGDKEYLVNVVKVNVSGASQVELKICS